MKIIKASERFHTKLDWLDSYHCFSFGDHYDPKKMNHGDLVVINDDIIEPSSGFGKHSHQNMDIVSWPLEGELTHQDSMGSKEKIDFGHVQYMPAGSGVTHSEFNDHPTKQCRLVQMWVKPSEENIDPIYSSKKIPATELEGFVNIIPNQIQINNQHAQLFWFALSEDDEAVELPHCNYAWLYVTNGTAQVKGEKLEAGDSLKVDSDDPKKVNFSGKFNALLWTF